MSDPVRTARRVFRIAGIYGLIVLLPFFFLEKMVGRSMPPALTHPEYYYGFLGAAATMQLVYLTIASDPVRFRPLMPIAMLAKLNFVVIVAILFAQGRLAPAGLSLPAIDLIIGLTFAWCWLRLRRTTA
jgi:hypothetical protein